ncbi:MAG: hydrogenase nickel incorporation protein HypB [candidate division WOR-3 bacterium]|nr:hydrogenase nickel incorporation protein HypB [candidate division WOR-3 bacterium]MCX7757220.1 hydrogenase nickel incorporation protein HypB [candidate division WOR-3 bacterium]MDW7987946.1 hydrogenase nickel incorporation protein HypB [candidate division WOR-3 bacterium]
MELKVFQRVMASNDAIANEYRAVLKKHNITVFNFMSAPGSGKTSLLEWTINEFKDKMRIAVIEGDIKGDLDAQRILKTGVPVYQINTDGACHLDAFMISQVLPKIDLNAFDVLFIENIGNLVCPAEFYIGADYNVMLLSTPEGSDKPTKYPLMFSRADVLLINKIDLIPYVNFNFEELTNSLNEIKPGLKILKISCKTGEGLKDWYQWLSYATNVNLVRP